VDYSRLARPSHELTKKSVKYFWGTSQQQAFETLKHKFTSYPVLRNPDNNRHFILNTDASAHAVKASLSQELDDGFYLVAYFSKLLTAPECNYNIYDCKLLSIIYAVKAFRYLLLGTKHKFLIRSDHNNLKYFRSAKQITLHQARWTEFLQDYDFELKHFPGKLNMIADLLSRRQDLEEGVKINENVTVLPETLFVCKIFLENNPKMQ
jgi:reverse transcriptase-like protein